MWARVRYLFDKSFENVPVSAFKPTKKGEPPSLVIGAEYSIFWSPEKTDTQEGILNTQGKILDLDDLREVKTRKGCMPPLKGYYRGHLLRLGASKQELEDNLSDKRVSIPSEKAIMEKHRQTNPKQTRKQRVREENKSKKEATSRATKQNVLTLLEKCSPNLQAKVVCDSDGSCYDPTEDSPSTPTSSGETTEAVESDVEEMKVTKKPKKLSSGEKNLQFLKKELKEQKARAEKYKHLYNSLLSKTKAANRNDSFLKRNVSDAAGSSKTAHKSLDLTFCSSSSTIPVTSVTSMDEYPSSFSSKARAITSSEALKDLDHDSVNVFKPIQSSPSPAYRESKAGSTMEKLLPSENKEQENTTDEIGPVLSNNTSLELSSAQDVTPIHTVALRAVRKGKAGDSQFCKNIATTLWGDEGLLGRSATGCKRSNDPTARQTKKLTPFKKETVKRKLVERIKLEEPTIPKDQLEERTSDTVINQYLEDKIMTVERAHKKRLSEESKKKEEEERKLAEEKRIKDFQDTLKAQQSDFMRSVLDQLKELRK